MSTIFHIIFEAKRTPVTKTTIPVADPGFPRGGGANSPGGDANIQFCQIFPKTA